MSTFTCMIRADLLSFLSFLWWKWWLLSLVLSIHRNEPRETMINNVKFDIWVDTRSLFSWRWWISSIDLNKKNNMKMNIITQVHFRGAFRPLYFLLPRAKRRVVDPSENVTPTTRFRNTMGCQFHPRALSQWVLQCLVFGSWKLQYCRSLSLNRSNLKIEWSEWHFPMGRPLGAPYPTTFFIHLGWLYVSSRVVSS